MQHEITTSRPLLNAKGNIAEPGFAKSLLPVYRRADVKVFTALSETVETGTQRVSFDVNSTLHSPRSTLDRRYHLCSMKSQLPLPF